MKKKQLDALCDEFFTELVDNTLAFWMRHSLDRKFGGFATILDRKGKLLSPDKPMWMTCRAIWLYSRLYNTLNRSEQWLTYAKHGIDFVQKYGFDTDGRMFFAVTADGRPLRKRRYLFTESFGVIAFAEYAKAANDPASLELAKRLMQMILTVPQSARALEPKTIPGTRMLRDLSQTMIKINCMQVLRSSQTDGDYDEMIAETIDQVFRYFVKDEKKAVLETVSENGEYLGSIPEGRCMNPGHVIETAWFIMEEGRIKKDSSLIARALPLVDWALEWGWDKKYGGMYYFVDVEGRQPVQLEWDMKLWWPHNEVILATLMAYCLSGEKHYLRRFLEAHTWSQNRFPDHKYGEWFGYLHRDGSLALNLKGSYWKGPFHLPRQQLYCHLLLRDMLSNVEVRM
jgi:N-acylglucosamine 2-epimerase